VIEGLRYRIVDFYFALLDGFCYASARTGPGLRQRFNEGL
jgi:hypothetical protein